VPAVVRALALSSLFSFACSPVDDVSFAIEFPDGASRDRAARIEVWISEDSCLGSSRVYDASFAVPGETAPAPRVLEPGHYFVAGRALDATCAVVVEGCLEIDFPIGRDELVLPLSEPGTSVACPPSQCDGGRCADCLPAFRVAAGAAHTCALATGRNGDEQARGRLFCWGSNSAGQLGLDVGSTDQPAEVSGFLFETIAAGADRTCAITAAGELFCWGDGEETPARVGADADWASVSLGATHGCAIKTGGELFCFGDGSSGQLGLGSVLSTAEPARVGDGTYRAVSAGANHTCAITTRGALECWGENESGQLGLDPDAKDCQSVIAGAQSMPARVGSGSDWLAIAAGSRLNADEFPEPATFACGVRPSGVSCWGRDVRGALGDGATHGQLSGCVRPPVEEARLSSLDGIALGAEHACAVGAGSLFCWGSSATGQIGLGVSTALLTRVPTPVAEGIEWQRVAAGDEHTCAIDSEGTVSCAGTNVDGRVGQPASEPIGELTATCLPF
jgi:hypothetical protein